MKEIKISSDKQFFISVTTRGDTLLTCGKHSDLNKWLLEP